MGYLSFYCFIFLVPILAKPKKFLNRFSKKEERIIWYFKTFNAIKLYIELKIIHKIVLYFSIFTVRDSLGQPLFGLLFERFFGVVYLIFSGLIIVFLCLIIFLEGVC